MAWIQGAAALGGAAISALGSGGGDVDVPSVWEQGEAALKLQNPNTTTPFGGTRLVIDKGEKIKGKNARADDTYAQVTELSPEMEALSSMLMGRAGAGRGTFSSGGMPEHIQNRYAQTGYEQSFSPFERQQRSQQRREGIDTGMPDDLSGFMPAQATFDRPEFAFGVGDGPAQVAPPPETEGLTNTDAIDWARSQGEISTPAANWLERWDDGSSSSLYNENWQPAEGALSENNQGYMQEIIRALSEAGMRGGVQAGGGAFDEAAGGMSIADKGEPSSRNWDPATYQNMIKALMGNNNGV